MEKYLHSLFKVIYFTVNKPVLFCKTPCLALRVLNKSECCNGANKTEDSSFLYFELPVLLKVSHCQLVKGVNSNIN